MTQSNNSISDNFNFFKIVFIIKMTKLLLLICMPVLILSWWDVGHMLTAAIAQIRLNQLDPYASVSFRELALAINPLCDNRTRTFIESAVWPDDLKGKNFGLDLWNQWHFVDTPYVSDALIPIVNYTESAMTSVITVEQARKALQTNLKNITAERSLFTRYLIHLVGDIHQPLHSVALYNHTYPKGDAGGNLLHLILLNGTSSNFHSFWDSGGFRVQNDSYNFVRPMNLQNTTEMKRLAASMINQYGNDIEGLAKNIDPAEWAKESFLIAQNTTYPFMMKGNKATEEYTNLVYETSRRRITLAGYRLANFAMSIFSSNSTKQTESHKSLKELEKMFMEHAKQNIGKLRDVFSRIPRAKLQSE